jgi:hypothetical protein
MVNKKFGFGILVLVLVFGMVMTGCSTFDSLDRENIGRFVNLEWLPNKDFTSLGLVFVETSYDRDSKGERGDIFTYQALLKEVKKLGGDYMINVVIDKKTEGTFITVFERPWKFTKGKVTWYGSATAIKYADSMKNIKTTTTTTQSTPPVTTTTTETIFVGSPSSGSSASGGLLGGGGGGSSPASSGSGGIGGFFAKLFKK